MKNVFRAVVLLIVSVSHSGVAMAQSSSSNYRVDESAFSSGSGTGSSASFSAQGSAGDLGVGFGDSAHYRAYGGPITPNEEYLEMIVSGAVIDLDTPSGDPGILSASETATGTGMFSVLAYLNSGYVVVSLSQTMTSENSDTIDPITTAASSTPGTEQFGMNLVANTSPAIGAVPALQPDASYANGEAAPGYDTADLFQYNAGDTIAQSGGDPAWGQTNFTISYIANISGITEAGLYSMDHILVAIPTF